LPQADNLIFKAMSQNENGGRQNIFYPPVLLKTVELTVFTCWMVTSNLSSKPYETENIKNQSI
jgi:hypothetical protein